MLDLLLNRPLQFGTATIKMSSKRLKVFKENQPDFFLNDYNKDSSVSKMIKKN